MVMAVAVVVMVVVAAVMVEVTAGSLSAGSPSCTVSSLVSSMRAETWNTSH